MSPPKSRHSEPRKTHIPSFSLLTPVWVQPCSPGAGVWTGVTSCAPTVVVASANGGLLGLDRRHGLRGGLGGGIAGGQLGCLGRVTVARGRVVLAVVVSVAARLEAGLEAPAVDGDDHHDRTDGCKAEVEDDPVADER